MATFKAEIYKHQKRSDGTWNVKIRVTHNRQKKYLSTPIYVKPDDITRTSYKLKKNITDKTDKMIEAYEAICANLGLKLKTMSVDELIAELEKGVKPQVENIDFISFSVKKIQEMDENEHSGSAKSYRTTIESLKRFIKRDTLAISEITSTFMEDYEKWLRDRKPLTNRVLGDRAISLYPGYIRALHNLAKKEYNDEEMGIIRIPWSPFAKYLVKKPTPAKKRNLSAEVIRKIINLPDGPETNIGLTRSILAKDVFALSFFLIGMNTADLYNCDSISDGRITYQRTKTKNRRSDKAEISVKIEPEAMPLVEKYLDKTKHRVFKFYKYYATADGLNAAVNRGLKKIGEEVGVNDLEFYSARHSWASIARNDLRINKYVVHEALNHVDDAMKVTDMYLEKDYSQNDDANRRVITYVLTGDDGVKRKKKK